MSLPNLAGVVTKDLVEKIGSGSFQASYVNWSRTLQLLRQHAPGWMVDTVPAADGSLVHRAPVGGYLLIRFVHIDGQVTPSVPQAIMDTRNNAIPYEKITARDITDTQRRGSCLAAAYFFGLAAELWAKMPLESGWGEDQPSSAPTPAPQAKAKPAAKAEPVAAKKAEPEATEDSFRATAIEKGFTTYAVDGLLQLINGDYERGIATLAKKTKSEVDKLNEQYAPKPDATEEEEW